MQTSRRRCGISSITCLVLYASVIQAKDGTNAPQAAIDNGVVRAKLYLPDAEKGYYQGTRFDWSGVFASLTYKGHNYFGPWFEKYDPKTNDAISGPVEEFLTGAPSVGHDTATAIGYTEAKPGETFIRIGVGVLRKPAEEKFNRFKTYEIVDAGTWKVEREAERVSFHHAIADASSGYAYEYMKIARLEPSKPLLVLQHSLKNTGRKPISTEVYDHNFLTIDGQPTGRDFTLTFPFDVTASGELNGFVETKGKQMVYVNDVGHQDKERQFVMAELKGYGSSSRDYDIRVENKKTGAGVHIAGDRPLQQILFWSVNTVLSPEPYLHFDIAPGETATWKITYEFYENANHGR
jgi:hypothetical protein